eukprot:757475-Hanusia_phi.AAC.1
MIFAGAALSALQSNVAVSPGYRQRARGGRLTESAPLFQPRHCPDPQFRRSTVAAASGGRGTVAQ